MKDGIFEFCEYFTLKWRMSYQLIHNIGMKIPEKVIKVHNKTRLKAWFGNCVCHICFPILYTYL